ncbi:MAG TPA: hypothetical protein VLU73_09520 [Methylococcaceae bacterium]|jgi:hypothetical protein|nr:hypothetical protein [Methylococcaceae bacterium]
MKPSFYALLFVPILLLAACSGTGEEQKPTEKNRALSRAVNEPLEKARKIETQLMNEAEITKRKIDEQLGQEAK